MATFAQAGVAGIGTIYMQPKLAHRFRVIFRNIAAGSSNDSKDLSIQLVTVSRPAIDFDEVVLDRYVSRAYVASKYNWTPCSFTFEDDVNSRAVSVVRDQLELQQRLIGADAGADWLNAAPTASNYKFGAALEMLDGNQTVLETWDMQGCWFQSLNFGQLDYADSNQVRVDVTMRFDHARHLLGANNLGTAVGGL